MIPLYSRRSWLLAFAAKATRVRPARTAMPSADLTRVLSSGAAGYERAMPERHFQTGVVMRGRFRPPQLTPQRPRGRYNGEK